MNRNVLMCIAIGIMILSAATLNAASSGVTSEPSGGSGGESVQEHVSHHLSQHDSFDGVSINSSGNQWDDEANFWLNARLEQVINGPYYQFENASTEFRQSKNPGEFEFDGWASFSILNEMPENPWIDYRKTQRRDIFGLDIYHSIDVRNYVEWVWQSPDQEPIQVLYPDIKISLSGNISPAEFSDVYTDINTWSWEDEQQLELHIHGSGKFIGTSEQVAEWSSLLQIPEPGTFTLLLTGAFAIITRRKRRC